MGSILCCGEVLIDMLPPEVPGGGLRAFPGGGPFNTAVALARLGLPTGFFCPLSQDGFGTQLAQHLRAEGVRLTHCPRSPAPTPLAVLSFDARRRASYGFYTSGTALCDLSRAQTKEVRARVALFGGISLALEPCGAAFEALFHRLHAEGRLLMIDPNMRHGVIADPTPWRARLGRMLPCAGIIKLSDEDLDFLSDSPEATLQSWLDAGVSLICLTRGAAGVRVLMRGLDLSLPAAPAQVVDTVGAGDSFNAGLLYGLWQSGLRDRAALGALTPDLARAAAQFAQKVAALTVSRKGANPPRAAEIIAQWQPPLPAD